MPSHSIVVDNFVGCCAVQRLVEDARRWLVLNLERADRHTLRIHRVDHARLGDAFAGDKVESKAFRNLACSILLACSKALFQHSQRQVLSNNLNRTKATTTTIDMRAKQLIDINTHKFI